MRLSISYDYLKQRISLLYQQWLAKLPFHEEQCSGIIIEALAVMYRELSEEPVSAHKVQLVKINS